jgi:TonB family protein
MWPAHSAKGASLNLNAEDQSASKTIGVVTKPALGNLRLVTQPQGAASDPEAWKKIIGDKSVSPRLQTLPKPNPRWSALLTGTIFQVLLAGLLIALPAVFPDKLASKSYEVVPIVAPETAIALPAEQPLVHPKIIATPPPPPLPAEEPPMPPSAAKLIAPKALNPPTPKPAPISTVDVPVLNEISAEAKFEAPPSEPAKPREPVKTGTLAAGGAAPPAMATATTDKPAAQVQTGGFGDPNGVPGDINPTVRANIAHAGSPALLSGPGFGNGTGSAKGVRGTVASSGFGNGVAISAASHGEGAREPLKAGGFGAEVTGSDAPSPKQAEAPPPVQPVVILSKPNPAYTDEARKLRIEGDVSVEVVFLASGSVRVVRVTNGLGHGLDEAAIHAAEQIRFKPALQDGKPADFPATVHIEFQLAF